SGGRQELRALFDLPPADGLCAACDHDRAAVTRSGLDASRPRLRLRAAYLGSWQLAGVYMANPSCSAPIALVARLTGGDPTLIRRPLPPDRDHRPDAVAAGQAHCLVEEEVVGGDVEPGGGELLAGEKPRALRVRGRVEAIRTDEVDA